MFPTKAFGREPPASRFTLLPETVSALEVADRCRVAALEFMEGTALGCWGRKELALWLISDYKRAVSVVAPTSGNRRRSVRSGDTLDEGTVEGLLLHTRERMLDMLIGSSECWEGVEFAREMIDSGLVVGVRDSLGAIGYAAVDHPGLRLVDRVASLFIADCLTRPADYRATVACEYCGAVSFAWPAEHHGECHLREVTTSGIVERFPHPETKRGVGG